MNNSDKTIQPRQKRGRGPWFAVAAAVVVLLAGAGYKNPQNEEEKQPAVETTEFGPTQNDLEALRKQAELEKKRADEAWEQYNAAANELNKTRSELNALREQAELEKKRADEAFAKSQAAEGKLEATKHELEILREQARLDRARADEVFEKYQAATIELVETKSELNKTQTQLNGMVRVLTDVNSEVAKAWTENNRYRETLAATEEKLNAAERLIEEKDKQIAEKNQDLFNSRKEADELKRQLANDVLSSYNTSTLELSFHLVNDRLFNNISIDKSFFLPAVSFGGKNWIVSAFRDTTGLTLYSDYTKVTELQYKVRRPQTKDAWAPVSGPALCLAEDSRVCLFPIPKESPSPMPILTYEKLRERGLDNLTLFKSGTFSKASADITGRCSLSLQVDDNHLYIRNSNRSSSELKAEVGDFVLSKEGCFVGVVVKVASTELGQASTAQCFIFTGEPELTKAFQLDLTRGSSQSSFSDFMEQHKTLRKLSEQLDKGR